MCITGFGTWIHSFDQHPFLSAASTPGTVLSVESDDDPCRHGAPSLMEEATSGHRNASSPQHGRWPEGETEGLRIQELDLVGRSGRG